MKSLNLPVYVARGPVTCCKLITGNVAQKQLGLKWASSGTCQQCPRHGIMGDLLAPVLLVQSPAVRFQYGGSCSPPSLSTKGLSHRYSSCEWFGSTPHGTSAVIPQVPVCKGNVQQAVGFLLRSLFAIHISDAKWMVLSGFSFFLLGVNNGAKGNTTCLFGQFPN